MASVEPAGDGIAANPGDPFGADASARLLLALTALYVQRSDHTAQEQQQFSALALGLINKAGPAARAAAAARLCRHADAPAAVIERLAGGQSSSSGAGAALSGAGLRAGDSAEQAAVESDVAAAKPGRQPLTAEFGEAFFAASPVERREMLSAIAAAGSGNAAADNDGRFHVRVDIAPWRARTGAFARDFERLIDAPNGLGERILNDPWGEPLVIAARATGMPVAVLQRILVLVSPVPHSVQRVYELTELYHAVSGDTARDLLAVWRLAASRGVGCAGEAPATVIGLRTRFRALNMRIESMAVRSRCGRGDAGRCDPPSR